MRNVAVGPLDVHTRACGQVDLDGLGIGGRRGRLERGLHASVSHGRITSGTESASVKRMNLSFGLVAAPTAKPPIAPATIPIKARTIALSTKVALARADIDPPPLCRTATLSLRDLARSDANCRKRAESGRMVVSVKDPERI